MRCFNCDYHDDGREDADNHVGDIQDTDNYRMILRMCVCVCMCVFVCLFVCKCVRAFGYVIYVCRNAFEWVVYFLGKLACA